MTTFSFDIEGMSCGHCVRAVQTALEGVGGVRTVEVKIGHAEVHADAPATRDALVAAIEEEGYRVTGR